MTNRQILTAVDIRALAAKGQTELIVRDHMMITDAAREEAGLTGVRIIENPSDLRADIVVKVAGEVIPARVLLDEAPNTSRSILGLLPLSGTVNHARLAGDELMFPIRTYIPAENQSKAQEEGNIAYWPDRMIICMFYGNTEGVGLTNVFAKVSGNFDGFRRAGEVVWKEQGAELRIESRLHD